MNFYTNPEALSGEEDWPPPHLKLTHGRDGFFPLGTAPGSTLKSFQPGLKSPLDFEIFIAFFKHQNVLPFP